MKRLTCVALGAALIAAGCGNSKNAVGISAARSVMSKGELVAFHTAPGIAAPDVQVRNPPGPKTSKGFIFITPRAAKPTQATGPMILDASGKLVWFHPVTGRTFVNFRVQRYKGTPVITWSERPPITSPDDLYRGDPKALYNVIADQSYNEIKKVRAVGPGVRTDLHEMTITGRDTALVLGFRNVDRDLSSVGGPRQGRVTDCLVQEIDLDTGRVLMSWSALQHVPLTDSEVPLPKNGVPWDYFHVNSVAEDSDGNLLVSGRHTSAIYKLDRESGRVIWRLGGKSSDFDVPAAARFAFQHDAHRTPRGTLMVFNNDATEFDKRAKASSVLELAIDEQAHRVALARKYVHSAPLLAASQGNAHVMPNGNVFVGWGNAPFFSEYSPDGKQVFDAALPSAKYQSYRAFKSEWTADPRSKPSIKAVHSGGRTVAYVSWNGATEVASWRVLGGARPGSVRELGTAPRKGFETKLTIAATPAVVELEALDSNGKSLGRSATVRVRG